MRYVLLALGGLVFCLFLICLVRAVRSRKKLPEVSPAISWTAEEERRYAEILSSLVKIPTLSRRQGESWETFSVYQEKLRALFPKIFETAECHDVDGNILLRIRGSAPEKGGVLLMGHQDVVPAEGQEGWIYPPFSGEIAEGKVWGRGAMDCKSTVCAEWIAVEELLNEGFSFKEDLWLFSSRNEENAGGGSELAAAYLEKNGVRLNAVLDEGGAVVTGVFPGLHSPCAAIGVAEKGFVNLKFTARGKGGHASTPPKNTPIVRLSRFISEVEKKEPFRKKFVSPIPEMFSVIAGYERFPLRFVMSNLWLFGGVLKRVLPKVSPMAGAFISATAAFTQSGGSPAPNVLPDSAYVICNVRPSLHEGAEECIGILRKIAQKYDIETEVLFKKEPSLVTDFSGEACRFLCAAVAEALPDTVVIPYLMTGGTDSCRFENVCDNIFRFTPTRLTKQQLDAMHAPNENLSVSALAEGAKVYKYYLEKYNA